jgi:hypothetical protein
MIRAEPSWTSRQHGESMADDRNPPAEHPCSFDEFKLYYESTERVTERRLAANRWNYSISVAILLAIAGIYSWTARNQYYLLIGALVILFITAIAALFSLFWLRQVEDWKALNSAKFQVLGEMAPRVRFDGANGPSDAESYRPFDKEWQILQRDKRLTKVRIKLGQLEALNASCSDLRHGVTVADTLSDLESVRGLSQQGAIRFPYGRGELHLPRCRPGPALRHQLAGVSGRRLLPEHGADDS